MRPLNEGSTLCADAHIWVCGACGKTSRTRYGFFKDEDGHTWETAPDGQRVASPGWDESCMLNAVLCYRDQRLRDSDGLKEWVAVLSAAEATDPQGLDPHTL
jgi:hypothetical protein